MIQHVHLIINPGFPWQNKKVCLKFKEQTIAEVYIWNKAFMLLKLLDASERKS